MSDLIPIDYADSVLIIDDNAAEASLIALALRNQGHESTLCLNIEEAVQHLARTEPRIAFLDFLLAGENPADFVRQAKKRYPNMPIVLMTSAPNADERAASIGLAFYLQKPFDLQAFSTVVERCLARRGQLQAISAGQENGT